MSDWRQGVTHYKTFHQEEAPTSLSARKTHARSDTGKDARLRAAVISSKKGCPQEASDTGSFSLICSEKPRKKKNDVTPPPNICLAPYLALSLASGRRCGHCWSKLISHYRLWTRRPDQIFNLLDISRVSATHYRMSQMASVFSSLSVDLTSNMAPPTSNLIRAPIKHLCGRAGPVNSLAGSQCDYSNIYCQCVFIFRLCVVRPVCRCTVCTVCV